ncbi:Clp protease N-terminal domain-containing protein [Kitasatospora nipponensis]|uniref:Clp protease N-terminal domain-containing protein n=1 Tax=Kitasatospora nipponensis TaxID=258049 RepID=A0ABP4DS65_9ACTN
MFETLSAGAREAVSSALQEARLRGDRRIGTEHLLLGVLHDPRSPAVDALGLDLATARGALDALDRVALAAVGIHADGVERRPVPASPKHTPLSSGARAVLPRAARVARAGGSRKVTPAHLLVALLERDLPDPVAELMAEAGVDRIAARVRLLPTGA